MSCGDPINECPYCRGQYYATTGEPLYPAKISHTLEIIHTLKEDEFTKAQAAFNRMQGLFFKHWPEYREELIIDECWPILCKYFRGE